MDFASLLGKYDSSNHAVGHHDRFSSVPLNEFRDSKYTQALLVSYTFLPPEE